MFFRRKPFRLFPQTGATFRAESATAGFRRWRGRAGAPAGSRRPWSRVAGSEAPPVASNTQEAVTRFRVVSGRAQRNSRNPASRGVHFELSTRVLACASALPVPCSTAHGRRQCPRRVRWRGKPVLPRSMVSGTPDPFEEEIVVPGCRPVPAAQGRRKSRRAAELFAGIPPAAACWSGCSGLCR